MAIILAIVAVWALVIPCVILAAAALVDRRVRTSRPQGRDGTITRLVGPGTRNEMPRCVQRRGRPGRATTRRACPEHAHRAWRRPAST